jgi:hypothetical protein
MIKKILALLAVIVAGISFYVICVQYNTPVTTWLLISHTVYMVIAAVAIIMKNRLLQAVTAPALIFYGGTIAITLPPPYKYAYAYISAAIMLVMAVYIIFGLIFKMKFKKLALGLLAVTYTGTNVVGEGERRITAYRENTLFNIEKIK